MDFKRYEARYFEVEIHPGKIQVAFVGGLPGQPALEWALDGDMLQGLSFEPRVRFEKGSFRIEERRRQVCQAERVERVEANSSRVVIYGWLCGETPFEIELESDKAGELHVQAKLKNGERLSGLAMEWMAGEKEQFFGLGSQFSNISLKGRRIPFGVEERRFLTTQSRYFWLGGRSYMTADFSEEGRIRVETWSRQLSFTVWQDPEPLALLEKASLRTGRPSPLPSWAFGTIVGVQGGKERAEEVLEALEADDCPVHAIWIQDWCGKAERYPHLREWIGGLAQRGVAALGCVNPFLTPGGPLFDEAWEKGYFVKNYLGRPYPIEADGLEAYLVDLTNPAAFSWYKGWIKKELIETGFAGWMAASGEWLPHDALLYSGIPVMSYHNQYAADWARLNREAIREAGKEGQVAIFSRPVPTAEHAAIVREEELLKRWIERSAFTPIFRTHEELRPELNASFARFAKTRQQLLPYLDSCMREAVEKGYPMMRHLYLHYPADPNILELDEQYLLGSDLLVAPVVRKKQTTVKAYLPEGQWKHFWSGEIYEGGKWYEAPAPVGEPAVWWRVN
jgi:alpha-glucosidase